MTFDSRDTQKEGGAAQSPPKNMALENIILATFYVTSRPYQQCFVFDNFYLSHKR